MKLREYREKRGVKQIAVANHLGVTRQTYASYEANQDAMSIEQAKAVCDFLKVGMDEIFLSKDVD